MRKVTITCKLRDHTYTTTFNSDMPEYVIADEAFRLAMLFAETQFVAIYGHPITNYSYMLSDFLKDLDYDYTIEGEKNDG